MKKIILALVVFVLFVTFTGCSSSSSTNQSSVSFEEVGYFKDGSTFGQNQRVKSVYVVNFKDDPQVWQEIEDYAKKEDFIWSKGDFDVIFFYNDKENTPGDVITLAKDFDTAMNFTEKYDQYCVAGYWHYTNGSEEFKKYPFK